MLPGPCVWWDTIEAMASHCFDRYSNCYNYYTKYSATACLQVAKGHRYATVVLL